jgi:hypothetical protein
MKKTMLALSLGLAFTVGALGTALAAETSVTGHLRDGFCYVVMGAHGPSHKKCAMGCAKAGIPVLLVQNKTDKYYVLLPPKNDEGLPDSVTSKMEDEVTVMGNEYSKGGITFLTVKSVK